MQLKITDMFSRDLPGAWQQQQCEGEPGDGLHVVLAEPAGEGGEAEHRDGHLSKETHSFLSFFKKKSKIFLSHDDAVDGGDERQVGYAPPPRGVPRPDEVG